MPEQVRVVVNVEKSKLNELKTDIEKIDGKHIKIQTTFDNDGKIKRNIETINVGLGKTEQIVTSVGRKGATVTRTLTQDMRKASTAGDLLGDSLTRIIGKMAAWQLLGNAISSVVRSFRDALDMMKAVDQELTNIAKVSDLTATEIERIGDSAYETASKYGVAANEYLQAVYTFQKAGIGDSSEEMAELATKTMLVGDTTAEVATRFLIAANAAWKFGGNVQELSRLVDEADKLNNTYAVTLEDIATGLPIVGATAAQVGMSAEQTMAAISTIVASTGQSATKAATALRAIIMNLIGETGTLEDGTEVTAETIASLNSVLKEYAADALAAAEAEGKILDPMEAIAALAKAAEDEFLNEAQLFEVLSGLGGKLRTTQLTALVNNTEMYYSMLGDVADAAGTADREISIMLDSWNAKTQILENTFTKFVAGLVSTDGIKSVIDGLTVAVGAMDTGFGRAVVSISAVSTLITALIKNVPALAKQLLGGGLVSAITAVVGAINAGSGALGIFTALWNASPFVVVTVAVAAIYGIVTAVDALTVSLEEATTEHKKLKDEFDTLYGSGSEYADLLSRVDSLTEAEHRRLGELKAEADELKKQVDYYAILAYQAWQKEKNVGGDTGIVSGMTGTDFGTHIVTSDNISVFSEAQAKYNAVLTSGTETLDSYEQTLSEVVTLLKDDAEVLIAAQEAGQELEPQEKELVDLYNEASEKLGKLTAAQEKNTEATKAGTEAAQAAAKPNKTLAELMKETEAGLDLTADAATNAAMQTQFYALQAAIASGQPIDTSSAISSLSGLSAQSTNTAAALQALIAVFKQINAMDKRIADYEQLAVGEMGYEYAGYLAKFTAERTGFDVAGAFQKAYAEALTNMPQGTKTPSGGSGSAKQETDEYLEGLKDLISYQKQYLSYLEASDASTEEQVAQMQAIQASLHEEADYLRSIEGESENVVQLSTEWWTIQNKINDLLDDAAEKEKALKEEFESAKEEALALLDAQEERALEPYNRQLEILKAQKETIEDERTEEERLLAVEKARIALQNAQNERNVRQYNSATGKWEWVANAQTVLQAEEALREAEIALDDFYRDRAINALQKNIDSIQSAYDKLREQIEFFAKAVANGTMSMAEAMMGMSGITGGGSTGDPVAAAKAWAEANAEKESATTGGIGSKTGKNVVTLSSGLTKSMASAGLGANTASVMASKGIVTAPVSHVSMTGSVVSPSIGTQHNGNNYSIGGVTISESKAKATSVYALAQEARKLALHSED